MPNNLLARGMQVPGRNAGDNSVAAGAAARASMAPAPAFPQPLFAAAPQGDQPAYASPAAATGFGVGTGAPGVSAFPGGSTLAPQLAASGLADDGSAIAGPVAAPGSVTPMRKTGLDAAVGRSAVDTSYGPQMDVNSVPGQVSIASQTPPGSGITTDHTRETDPKTHSVEDFVAANSHLTPLDIQILQQGKLTPHDQILNSIHQATQSIRARDEATAMMNYRSATQGLDPNNAQHKATILAETNKLAAAKIAAETKQMKALSPFVVPAYLNTPGAIQAEQDARKQAQANKPEG